MNDGGLILMLGVLHLLALGAGAGLLVYALRTGEPYEPPEDDSGGGGGPPPPPPRPVGGPPLADATPARVRLRGSERLGDRVPAPPRRRAREHTPRVPSKS